MRRRWLALLLCLAVCPLALVRFVAADDAALRVNEHDTQISFDDQQTKLTLALENNTGQPLSARVQLELFDPENRVRAATVRAEQINIGASRLTVPLAPSLLSALDDNERAQLLWYRLHYRITQANAGAELVLAEGVVSVSQLQAPDLFELHVAAPRSARSGQTYRAHIHAQRPLTAQPVASVRVEGAVTFDGANGDDVVLKAAGVTDAQGDVALDFKLPREIDDEDAEIKITARRGDFAQTAESEFDFERTAQLLISTDKPLYQPGQTLHVRALIFDPAKHALANTEAQLYISDPEDTTVFNATLKTSRFGVASADWLVPDNTRLGDYRLNVKIEDGCYEDSEATANVRISRYELPNFVVGVKPDRQFYLPGQNAEVEVRADYLFGEPVKRGHVRVVRETERKWNYREQKWDIEEADKYEGETDAAGRFIAHINLKPAQDDFADENYARFRDLTYAAYFTDPTTNRTEQRRFDLRLTHDPIHIYVLEGPSQQARNMPMEFYVSTSYADGTPAPCAVTIREAEENDDAQAHKSSAPALQTIKTNKYGVAKVTGLVLPKHQADGSRQVELQFNARDDKGQSGQHTEEFYPSDDTVVRVATDKALYRPGEPVQVEITANVPELKLGLDVARDALVLRSQLVELHDGRATVTLPFTPEFHDEITIAAYVFGARNGDNDNYDYTAGSRTVLFPRRRDLQLDVQLSKAEYQPGEDAHASFRVRDATGRNAESALGVVVFDEAVEERARTDSEFGTNSFYSLYRYWHGSDALAGFTRNDLNRIDLAQPIPLDLDLVAEILLRDGGLEPRLFGGDDLEANESAIFDKLVKAQLSLLTKTLNGRYDAQSIYPTDEAVMRRLLSVSGVSFNALRDPWGTPYRARFSVERANDVLEIMSAGADKRFDTSDDFVAARFTRPYFRFNGEAINRAGARFHARTGLFIRDAATLKDELAREGINFETLRDPWGQAYRLSFDAVGTQYRIVVESSGPDQRFELANDPQADDVNVWTAVIDYSTDVRAQVDAALMREFDATRHFPQNSAEFNAALARSSVDANALRDPWGHPFYPTFRQDARYTDRVVVQSYAKYGEQPKERTEITPVTESVNYIDLRSAGPDGKEGTTDDFDVASFMRIVTEQAAKDKTPQPTATPVQFIGGSGAISGTITDPQGAVVANATVQAKHSISAQTFSATSDAEGKYLLRNLPAGIYTVVFSMAGFKDLTFTDVPVHSSSLTKLDGMLQVGSIAETVEITSSGATVVDATTSQVTRQFTNLPSNGRQMKNLALLRPGVNLVTKSGETATPRLREYFPETLLWQPSLETDRSGRAQLSFKLADNITTWKLSVFGSTEDGQVGAVEREIRAFQPFFVEHDPPRILTEGDEIMLPVVLRNYLDKPQQVSVQIKPADWFTLLTDGERHANVPAGDATRELFGFRAIASVKDGKQRVTAIGRDASDAIERPVNVHPDGEEIAQSNVQLINGSGMLDVSVPANAIPRSAHAELKLYPNLMTHVIESVEAIMERPYGCAEQTISSTYPSLLVLRHYKHLHGDDAGRPAVAVKAEKYLRAGYERLLSYRAPGGGFSYWGRGDADLALTAYAVRFLEDASPFIKVDEDVLQAARTWLVQQQQQDGSWPASEWDKKQSGRRTLLLTAYIARVLAMHKDDADKTKTPTQPASSQSPTQISPMSAQATSKDPARAPRPTPLAHALAFLAGHLDDVDEPYFIAAYTLAAIDGGAPPDAIVKATAKLRALAHEEAGGAYWALETNTPFYGWGLAGRIETTALVVQALTKTAGSRQQAVGSGQPEQADSLPVDDLANRGLIFLLRNKDAHGVWLSTQATVNVLDALVALSPERGAGASGHESAPASRAVETVEVFVNGQRAGTLDLPSDERFDAPLALDLSRSIASGLNRIEIRRASGASKTVAQIVTTYYVPWSVHATEAMQHASALVSNTLRLAVNFDKTRAAAGEEVTCRVEAERIGFSGYGMMLAEVGLPPGADVDRASLERAMKESGWDLNGYDILPDRLIVYLWPRAGGTHFTFNFRPRYGLNAQTAPSVLYDYYNPEARMVLAPTRFNVVERQQTQQARQ